MRLPSPSLPTLLALLPLALLLPAGGARADTMPAGAIVVTSPTDGADPAPADGVCDGDADADGAQCTLRAAIQTANARKGADTIGFALPGTRRIAVTGEALPPVTETVTIDGYTQAGVSTATGPLVELDGAGVPAGAGAGAEAAKVAGAAPRDRAARLSTAVRPAIAQFKRPWGLDLRDADGSTIRGLIVHDFPATQVGLDGSDQAVVTGNWIGLDAAGGAQARGAGTGDGAGLLLLSSAQSRIGGTGRDRNVVSGNDHGIVLFGAGARDDLVFANYVGTTTDGLGRRPNHDAQILLTHEPGVGDTGTHGARIVGNVVVGDEDALGIDVLGAAGAEVIGNFVGMNAAGAVRSPTGEKLGLDVGIYVNDSPDTAIGGAGTAEFNNVTGNGRGIEVNGGSDRTRVLGNRIGTTFAGDGATDPDGNATGNRYGVAIDADAESEAPEDVVVGGTAPGAGNVIAASEVYGMYASGGVRDIVVAGNRIGTDADGLAAAGNLDGVAIRFERGALWRTRTANGKSRLWVGSEHAPPVAISRRAEKMRTHSRERAGGHG